jgi:hypothetical protein
MDVDEADDRGDLLDRLENWRVADPKNRYWTLARFNHPEKADYVRFCLSDGSDYVWTYDCKMPDRPTHRCMVYLGTETTRGSVKDVIAAGLEAWQRLYGEQKEGEK